MYLKLFCAFIALTLFFSFNISLAQEQLPFQGEIIANNINVRSDATVSSEIICTLNKKDRVEALSLLYEWYKIRLPKSAPAFIRKDLVADNNAKAAIIAKDNVNIRLRPNETSPIIGRAKKNQPITILAGEGDWYRIEPVNNSFGWVHNKFVKAQVPEGKDKERISGELKGYGYVGVEGVLKPYGRFFRRVATHKLITEDGKIFLLKGNKADLNALNHRKIRVTGEVISLPRQKYPVIEVSSLEALN